ncbi:glycosyltransferase [Halobacterium jilantaiense]|uniref:glycosyltransferase n=1 Tax=Halobacterium jilantaiense TaxID=355548 RepID=UPI001FE0596D|nr:glycosyltransferase [Halobacterium jilantaiense]
MDLIIPVYNDSTGIRETLSSVTELSSKAVELRVFVVDNGSSDETPTVSMELAEDHEFVNVLIEDEIQGSYAARNAGIRNSNGEVIVFLDADERVPPNFVENVLSTVETQNVSYLGCNVEVCNSAPGITAKYNQQNAFPVEQYLSQEHYAPTCALVVRREVFEDVGLFDARLISGGDREFGERVHEAGYKQGYAEDATVYHPARTSFESLAKKNFRVGRGFCQKQRYYPERYGNPGIPPKPNGPSGGDDGDEPDSIFTRLAFMFLSVAMLACRGVGYYYEFFFGEGRDDIPAPTS